MGKQAKIIAILLVLALAGSASARVITVEVEGVVDLLWTYDGFAFDDSVNIGSAITGFCTYDTDTADQASSEYSGRYPLISISMSIGNYTFTHDPMSSISALFEVSIIGNSYKAYSSDSRFDGTVYLDGTPKTFEDFSWTTFGLTLMYLNTTLGEYIPTDALPDLDSWPDLSIFDTEKFIGVGTDEGGPGFYIDGEITSLTVVPESAMTYYVNAAEGSDNNDGLSPQTAFATIQKAINSALDGDTVLVADGTYTGPGNRDIDFLGKAITVRSESGPENCIIDCNASRGDSHRAFYIESGETGDSCVEGFTITNGYTNGVIYCRETSVTINNCIITGNSSQQPGGAITCLDVSRLTVTNCTITSNQAAAIACWGSNAIIANSTIAENEECGILSWDSNFAIVNCSIYENAGGIYCEGRRRAPSLTITDSTIARNTGGGGILFAGHNLTIENCSIIDNIGEWQGGGIYYAGNRLAITNCVISKNRSWGGGGGIYCRGHSHGGVTIANSEITGNQATWGGGIYLWSVECYIAITNCLISGNTATGYEGQFADGGGIGFAYCSSCGEFGAFAVSNCTITGNKANNGGGIHCFRSEPAITNCILWDNEAPNGPQMYLAYSGTNVSYSDVQGGWAGEGNIDDDPCFVELGYRDANDTPDDVNDDFWIEGDYYLLPDSLCIDAGDPNYVAEPNETDIDGNPRVIDGRIDMGAYEANYIQAAMKLTPQMLNCNSKGKYVKAHLTLPEGFLPEDVDVNEPAVAKPMGVQSEYIKVLGSDKSLVRLEIYFDREAFCYLLTDDDSLEVTVIGSLTTSRYFYATDTIKIKPRR